MKTRLKAVAGVVTLLAAGAVGAVPISYEGSLTPGVTTGGFINDPEQTGSPNDDFWSFSAVAGETVRITVNRLNADLDPALYLYAGVGSDTNLLTQVASADDELPELPGFAGPWADPQLSYVVQTTGMFTVQVWDFASGPQIPGGFCYQITLNGSPTSQQFGCDATTGNVPEPSSLALAGLALFGAVAVRRATRKAR